MDVFTSSTASSTVTRANVTSSYDAITPILLAGGAGSRFRDVGHKLTAELIEHRERPAETVFARSLASVIDAEIGRVIVVTGRLDAHDLTSRRVVVRNGAKDRTHLPLKHCR